MVPVGRETLLKLQGQSPEAEYVFTNPNTGTRDTDIKKSFSAACREAGITNFTFHDLRHTAATSLVGANIPPSEVGRVLGHTQANTTYRYVNANIETSRRAAAALDAFNAEPEAPKPATETVT